MEKILIITAAGPKTWRREYLDPRALTRWFGEGLISDYKEKMEVLRQVDAKIREWTDDFDRWIFNIDRELKNALKSNRFIDLAISLADLNQRLKNISTFGKKVTDLEESSFQEFDTQHDQYLDPELFKADDGFISEAGMWSDWKRQWVTRKLETKKRRDRQIALEQLVVYAKNMVARINIYLDDMDKYRSYGQIGKYIDELKKISKEQIAFEKTFKKVYNNYLKEMVDTAIAKQKADEISKEIQEKNQNAEKETAISEQDIPDLEESQRQTLYGEPIPEALTQVQPKNIQDVSQKQDSTPAPQALNEPEQPLAQVLSIRKIKSPQDLKEVPEDEKPKKKSTTRKKKEKQEPQEPQGQEDQPQLESEKSEEKEIKTSMLQYQHLKFIGDLIKSSNYNDPSLIASKILQYSHHIDDLDPVASAALTRIASHLLQP